jgi:hypothetical protein
VDDGDAEAATLGEGVGVGDTASSADEVAQPASPALRARARTSGADLLSGPRRLDIGDSSESAEEQEYTEESEGKQGTFTKASSHEKG